MNELREVIKGFISVEINKIIISNPSSSKNEYKKIVIENKADFFQIAKYTDKQVFHENVTVNELADRIAELSYDSFKQINALSNDAEHIVLISKKGKISYKKKTSAAFKTVNAAKSVNVSSSHNRKKNYIFSEGMNIPPLVDMGIFTKEGKVVNSMYDKFKQINRFIEIIDDEVSKLNPKSLNVIDFGCGKSYLTFLLYFYLVEIKEIDANIIGLDLKEAVIDKCNKSARAYGYFNLRFELGDINGYKAPFDVDMVITLHACDTATDYALYNAINWNAKMIFSVPCCQHELNKQFDSDTFSILSRYGIVKERFSALATDAIRA
ncbi:MAG: SAM-dependent methyltransferase, partial [Lachnospiraceae bacterium]|nr:SAM-dependent methyltransferase [Lachnospiraceae bacterium]